MLRYLGIFTTVVGLALLSACLPRPGDDDRREALYRQMATPVAVAQEAGLEVYWLGDRVEVDGLVFEPLGAHLDGPDGTPPLRFDYAAEGQGGGSVVFTLGISRGGRYEDAIEGQLSRPGRVTWEETTVAGWPAALFERAVGRWTNVVVFVDAPGSLVSARANASIAEGRQVNPLNDPDQLLAVLEDLRPYPE